MCVITALLLVVSLFYMPSLFHQALNVCGATVALGTRLAVITADAIVLAVTWTKTYTTRKDGLRLGMEIPLTSLLLRDGLSCFKLLIQVLTANY